MPGQRNVDRHRAAGEHARGERLGHRRIVGAAHRPGEPRSSPARVRSGHRDRRPRRPPCSCPDAAVRGSAARRRRRTAGRAPVGHVLGQRLHEGQRLAIRV